jgi:outer membrane protein OmpA-like peptidoglycan-associated protein
MSYLGLKRKRSASLPCALLCAVTLVLGIGAGFLAGLTVAATFTKSELVIPTSPIELRVNVSGIPSPSGSSPIGGSQAGLGSGFLDALADNARQAIEAARKKTSDAVQIPTVAAEEFVKGLSHEAGKSLVGFFSELIKAGFGTSAEKDNERQRFSMVIRQDLINYNRASPIPVIVDCPETQTLERSTMLKQVLFDTNRSVPTDSADQVIDQVREFARTRPGSVLLLSGNTDTTGSDRRNSLLAQQRVASVKVRLIQSGGIAPGRIFSNELATRSLPVVTAQDKSEPRNRAVTIEVRD